MCTTIFASHKITGILAADITVTILIHMIVTNLAYIIIAPLAHVLIIILVTSLGKKAKKTIWLLLLVVRAVL